MRAPASWGSSDPDTVLSGGRKSARKRISGLGINCYLVMETASICVVSTVGNVKTCEQ